MSPASADPGPQRDRERLGVEDSRPPLSTGSTRWGWTVLTLSVVVVVFTLAVLANI
ncbi:hypothetical protein [Microbacterium sp. LMI1x-1-1.1]|uniref:hypothetical protein n=1 Tax=Microbacterium sp. LMI1x-1-1.1 TaxID=3135246 RepID=UPI00343FAAA8